MTAPTRLRRIARWGAGLGVPLLLLWAAAGRAGIAVAADTITYSNLLDRPMADVALLPATGDPSSPSTATPPMLVLEADAPTSTSARLDVLRRQGAWRSVATLDVDLERDGLDARWLVALGDDRFALVATSPRRATGSGRATVVALDVVADDTGASITEVGRQSFERAIEATGAADVDGFGSAELVLGMRTLYDVTGACGSTSLVVVDGSAVSMRRMIDLPDPIGTGVIGRFGSGPGDDLLLYSGSDCAPGGTVVSRLVVIHLADGTRIGEGVPSSVLGNPIYVASTEFPEPLRIDLDGRPPNEAIAMTVNGLELIDPGRGWRGTPIAPAGSVPLVAGPTGGPSPSGVRLAMLEAVGTSALVTASLRRDKAGSVMLEMGSELSGRDLDPLRWAMLATSIQAAATHQMPSNAWLGDAVREGCPDLLLPGAILPCEAKDLRSGPGWLATRPIGAVLINGKRVLLIAAGLDWQPGSELPLSPTPVASAPAGWWRHGPSPRFAIAEIRSDDLVSLTRLPKPSAKIGSTAPQDGDASVIGMTGTRLFTAISPIAGIAEAPPAATDARDALTREPAPGGTTEVVHVAASPGLGSQDESVLPLRVGDLRGGDGSPASHWAIRVVPVNDWGEWGAPVSQVITPDITAPSVAVEVPFTSPVWPFVAEITGHSEPGTTIHVEGVRDVTVDLRGRFTFDRQLAPWPQTIRVTAVDPTGNQTVSEVSVIGGVDYRLLPWPGIGAAVLLTLVAARGLSGGGRRRDTDMTASRLSAGSIDDASNPEIEELPPGTGVARG